MTVGELIRFFLDSNIPLYTRVCIGAELNLFQKEYIYYKDNTLTLLSPYEYSELNESEAKL